MVEVDTATTSVTPTAGAPTHSTYGTPMDGGAGSNVGDSPTPPGTNSGTDAPMPSGEKAGSDSLTPFMGSAK